MRTRVHAIMDTIWPLGFVLIAVVSFLLSAGSGVVGRRVLVLVLTAVWGLRLGAHIYTRNRGQGRVMWFVSVPVQAAMYEHAPLGLVSWLGAAVWAVGFGFEASGSAAAPNPGRSGQRRAAAREAHGAVQGGGVRRVRSAHQWLHPPPAALRGWAGGQRIGYECPYSSTNCIHTPVASCPAARPIVLSR